MHLESHRQQVEDTALSTYLLGRRTCWRGSELPMGGGVSTGFLRPDTLGWEWLLGLIA